ncbi:hypothetical protein CCHR01_08219 [Colletotrichum chrysophilum]|uniref:Uncharacterized protein n=1 Tax=Colletotrichum chrysophilum TaxID=1836956 RepID=A0AAD9AJC9_9PEZI|nr:hypothetical protein CCHR01_08219 [Colletotrichum chrysophilum]
MTLLLLPSRIPFYTAFTYTLSEIMSLEVVGSLLITLGCSTMIKDMAGRYEVKSYLCFCFTAFPIERTDHQNIKRFAPFLVAS